MANKRLENLYNQIFEQVYPHIQNRGRGVLYTVMHIILYAEQQRSENICNYFNITGSATLNDDQMIVDGLISNPNENLFNPINLLKDKKKMELFWIVVIACTLAGAYSSIKYLEYIKEQKATQERGSNTISSQSVTPPPQSLTAALCLVVPAYVVGDLRKDYPINASKLEKLIDAASYFLCTKVEDAESKQQYLELTDENIATVGEQQEVYLRINIADGQEMIGKKVPYILKRNLPSNGQGVVRQLACLKNLSGLETFNRV